MSPLPVSGESPRSLFGHRSSIFQAVASVNSEQFHLNEFDVRQHQLPPRPTAPVLSAAARSPSPLIRNLFTLMPPSRERLLSILPGNRIIGVVIESPAGPIIRWQSLCTDNTQIQHAGIYPDLQLNDGTCWGIQLIRTPGGYELKPSSNIYGYVSKDKLSSVIPLIMTQLRNSIPSGFSLTIPSDLSETILMTSCAKERKKVSSERKSEYSPAAYLQELSRLVQRCAASNGIPFMPLVIDSPPPSQASSPAMSAHSYRSYDASSLRSNASSGESVSTSSAELPPLQRQLLPPPSPQEPPLSPKSPLPPLSSLPNEDKHHKHHHHRHHHDRAKDAALPLLVPAG
jgi:hypothetical protein